MYVIEYVASPIGLDSPILHAELANGCTVDEAIHQAVHRLPALNAKYGAKGYQIFTSIGLESSSARGDMATTPNRSAFPPASSSPRRCALQ